MSDLGPANSPDWTDEVANRIESLVGTVRDRTTVPATKAARAVVFGVVLASMGMLALVLLTMAVLRLHLYLPFHPERRKVWTTYAGLGAIFLVAGAFLWRKSKPRGE
jgi:hypothetical protein